MTDDDAVPKSGTEQFEALAHFITKRLVPMHVSTDDMDTFAVRAHAADLGAIQLANVWARNAFVARRTRKLIVSTDPDYLKVIVQLRGNSVVTQNRREAALVPGDFVLYDTARPYHLVSSGQFEMQAVTFARDALPLSASQLERLTTHPICAREGLGALVSNYLRGLTQLFENDHGSSTYVTDATLDLLTAVLTERLDGASGMRSFEGRKTGLLLQVHAYIEHRLSSPDLNVPEIAAAHHISVRTLQKLFEAEGHTVSGWIRARRMEHCRRDLANPSLADRPVNAVGVRWGIRDPSQFSRLFKSTYDVTPREYRACTLAEATKTAGDVQ